MKLLNWIKPRTATVEELREQLANATRTHEGAIAAAEAAQEAFDDAGDQGAAKALASAREAAQHAAEHVGRARRLLDAAGAQRAAEARAELQARHDALAAELGALDVIDAALVKRAGAAFISVCTVQAERHEHFRQRAAKRHELERMHQALGHAPSARLHYEQPYLQPIGRLVREHMNQLPMGPVAELAHSIANLLDPNFMAR